MRRLFVLFVFVLLHGEVSAKLSGVVRASAVSNNAQPSFLDEGTGSFRSSNTDVLLSQALLVADIDIGKNMMFHGVANAYSDGDKQLGLTQAFIEYKPLSASKYNYSGRVGFFYPRLSVENTDKGWLANHFITSSAINSWIGEELRVPGVELSIKRSARKARSPWNLRLDLGAYKGNDTTGTLLAWRGFAIHDRQTLHHERVSFAPFPSVVGPKYFSAPNFTEPFTEIDGRTGVYLGLQGLYLRSLDVRYFYYDNRANPLIVNDLRLYAWRTKFHSLAIRYLINKQTELSGHLMLGSTEMGERLVFGEFSAAYMAISHSLGAHRLSLRLDVFDVDEDDFVVKDYNTSNGSAVTANYTYSLAKDWDLAVEAIYSKNSFTNRQSLAISPKQEDLQSQLALTYRF